jgi:hypothetical protein
MKVGFAMGLGFVATVQLTNTLFGRKPAIPNQHTGYRFGLFSGHGRDPGSEPAV